MIYLFLCNERGEYEGWQSGFEEDDVLRMRRQGVRFAVSDKDDLDERYYVPNMSDPQSKWEVVKRPKLRLRPDKVSIEANGQDAVTITGLPQPCKVIVDDELIYDIEDGTAEITCDIPGQYIVVVDCWPYMPWQTAIRALEGKVT